MVKNITPTDKRPININKTGTNMNLTRVNENNIRYDNTIEYAINEIKSKMISLEQIVESNLMKINTLASLLEKLLDNEQ